MTERAPITYTCAACGETFISGWTDEEARAEQRETFPDIPDEKMVVVCDVCYKQMMALYKQHQERILL